MRWLRAGLVIVLALALLAALPALWDPREQKIEIYRAFAEAYSEGHRINLANETTRFDAPTEAVLDCAPTVFLTTLVSRHIRTTGLKQGDFPGSTVTVVDPATHAEEMRARDPMAAIAEGTSVERAVTAAVETGLLQVSEVGFDVSGGHALMTYSFTCGSLCGHGGTALLDRVGGRWTLSSRTCGPVWIS
jgi:hypothetical protein